jgi:hypothetical protein
VQDLIAFIKQNWAGKKYEIPKAVFYLPKFVETISGKLNRPATIQLITSI